VMRGHASRITDHFSFLPSSHDKLVSAFVVSSFIPASRLTPRSDRVAATRSLAFAPAVWVIHRVHRHAAHLRPAPQPPRATRLAQRNITVLDVTDLTDGRVAVDVYFADLTARQAKLRPIAFLRDKLRRAARSPHHLCALARPELDVVNGCAERNRLKRERVAGDDVSIGSRNNGLSDLQPDRSDDVALLAIQIMQQRDQRRAVRIVFHRRDFCWNSCLVALEVDDAIHSPGAASATTHRYVTVVVAPRDASL